MTGNHVNRGMKKFSKKQLTTLWSLPNFVPTSSQLRPYAAMAVSETTMGTMNRSEQSGRRGLSLDYGHRLPPPLGAHLPRWGQSCAEDFQNSSPSRSHGLSCGSWRGSSDSWIGSSSAQHEADTGPVQQGQIFRYDYDYDRLVVSSCCRPAERTRERMPEGQDLARRRSRSCSVIGNRVGRIKEIWSRLSTPDAIG